jgi:hypothetical protein
MSKEIKHLVIKRPDDMSIERFLTLCARLEKLVGQLGGNVRIMKEKDNE